MSREEDAPRIVRLADSERVNPLSKQIKLIRLRDNLLVSPNSRLFMIGTLAIDKMHVPRGTF